MPTTVDVYGNCYRVTEAAFHIMGGKKAGWQPMRVLVSRSGYRWHWFLKHSSGVIVDLSRRQYDRRTRKPQYSKAVRAGFLTTEPSKATKRLMVEMTWQIEAKGARREGAAETLMERF